MTQDAVARHDLAWETSRWLDVDGVEIHHEVAGPDRAHPDDRGRESGPDGVLLLHHFYGNTRSFHEVQTRLAEAGIRSISFDRPGFGLTERPKQLRGHHGNLYARDANLRYIDALLDRNGFARPLVVGASMGGTLAIRHAATRPERTAGLALLAPAITGDVGVPPPLRGIARTVAGRRFGSWLVRRFTGQIDASRVASGWADPTRVPDELVDAYQRSMRAEGWDRGLWNVMSAEPPPRLGETIAGLTVPTWVVTGDRDRTIAPKANARTAAAILGAQLMTIDGSGHTPHEEQPAQVASHLIEIVARLRAPDRQAQPAG